MKYKYYYIRDVKKCVIAEYDCEENVLQTSSNNIVVSLSENNVSNLGNFFKAAVVKALIEKDYNIELNSEEIEKEEFFENESFVEFRNLIDSSINKCNEALKTMKNKLEVPNVAK